MASYQATIGELQTFISQRQGLNIKLREGAAGEESFLRMFKGITLLSKVKAISGSNIQHYLL